MNFVRIGAVALVLALMLPLSPAQAGELTLELNNMSPNKSACRVSFLIRNGFDKAITKSAFELVLFGKDKRTLRIVVVKPGLLPPSKSRVKQFDLKGVNCTQVARVLLNDVRECDGEGLNPAMCLTASKPSSLLSVPFDF